MMGSNAHLMLNDASFMIHEWVMMVNDNGQFEDC